MHPYLIVLLIWCDVAFFSWAAASAALKETPLNKWTPQRVRNTRHQPLSAMVSMYLLYVGTLSRYPVVLFTITTLTHNASVCRNGISRRTALLDSRVAKPTFSPARRWDGKPWLNLLFYTVYLYVCVFVWQCQKMFLSTLHKYCLTSNHKRESGTNLNEHIKSLS